MFEAQILLAEPNAKTEVFSRWFPREGDNVEFTIDTVRSGANVTGFDVGVFHKNTNDEGDGKVTGVAIDASSVGRAKGAYGALKELVRFKFTLQAGGKADDALLQFRVLRPSWLESVTA